MRCLEDSFVRWVHENEPLLARDHAVDVVLSKDLSNVSPVLVIIMDHGLATSTTHPEVVRVQKAQKPQSRHRAQADGGEPATAPAG